nr:cysteine dioxygenase family protein [Actinopolyspora biskrensis]
MFAVPPNTVANASDLARAHPVRIARETAYTRRSWAHLVRYDRERRWAVLLRRTADYEVWILSWLPGQHTELHDHGGADGAFTVVSGVLNERAVRSDSGHHPAEALHTLVAGQSRVFGPNYAHQVHNEGPDPAISIHVYRPWRAVNPSS